MRGYSFRPGICDTFYIGNIHLAGQFWMFFGIVKYHVAKCFFASLSFFGKWHVAGQFWRCANTLDRIFQKRKFHVATKIWMSPVPDMYWLPGKFEWGLYWTSINCQRNLNAICIWKVQVARHFWKMNFAATRDWTPVKVLGAHKNSQPISARQSIGLLGDFPVGSQGRSWTLSATVSRS